MLPATDRFSHARVLMIIYWWTEDCNARSDRDGFRFSSGHSRLSSLRQTWSRLYLSLSAGRVSDMKTGRLPRSSVMLSPRMTRSHHKEKVVGRAAQCLLLRLKLTSKYDRALDACCNPLQRMHFAILLTQLRLPEGQAHQSCRRALVWHVARPA